jgi:hypothetical protein
MQSQKIKLFEFYNLDVELNGRVNQQTGQKVATGILDEKLTLVAKYWLTQLANTVKAEVSLLDAQRDELIKKYGTADEEGGVSLAPALVETDESGVEIRKPNPKFIEFNQEFNEFLSIEKDITYAPIKLSDIASIESENNYATLFKFIEA